MVISAFWLQLTPFFSGGGFRFLNAALFPARHYPDLCFTEREYTLMFTAHQSAAPILVATIMAHQL